MVSVEIWMILEKYRRFMDKALPEMQYLICNARTIILQGSIGANNLCINT